MFLLQGFAGKRLAADVWPGASLPVGKLMTPASSLITLSPDISLKQAATIFVEAGIIGAPAVEGTKLVGVISQTDLLYLVQARQFQLTDDERPGSVLDSVRRRHRAPEQDQGRDCSLIDVPRPSPYLTVVDDPGGGR